MIIILGGYCITVGSTATIETLCSQAWTGARDKTLVGLYLQRALVILLGVLSLIAVVFWHGDQLLTSMGQDPEIAALAVVYLRYSFFSMAAYTAFDAYRKFLLAQGVVLPSTFILIGAVPLNAAMQFLFIFVLDLGLRGAPLAMGLVHLLMVFSLVSYATLYCPEIKRSWGGWSLKCLDQWGPYLKQASGNVLTMCCECYVVEASVLAISYLGRTEIAAQSILARTYVASRVLGFGLSAASATRVGNALGHGAPEDARQIFNAGCILSIIFSLPVSILFLCTRTSYGYLFTEDEQVLRHVADALPIFALFEIISTLSGHCAGVLRGLGRQQISAAVGFVSYYLIGGPIALTLVFKAGWSVTGLWVGLAVGFFFYATIQLLFLCMVNWDAECRRVEVHLALQKH
ncbi:mate-domain-containing protein [Dichotomocladium elegans]|nr:mate-domain-containing protein [Dichotomocladium elegans]